MKIKSIISYLDGYKISEGIGDNDKIADQAALTSAVKKGYTQNMLDTYGYTIKHQVIMSA
jgi:hypothetical protein